MVRSGYELALPRFFRRRLMGFRYWLPSLPEQVFQDLTERKLLCDGLDNILQFIFAASKGTFPFARRNGEIERVIPDRVPWEVLFQKRIFLDRQNEKVFANPLSHYFRMKEKDFSDGLRLHQRIGSHAES